MRLRISLAAATTVVMHLVASAAFGQGLGNTLSGVGKAYAEAYVQPLVDAFGADINSGLFHTAAVGGGVLPMVDVYLGVKVFGALVAPSDQEMNLSYTAPRSVVGSDGRRHTVDVHYDISGAPTVFGSTAERTAIATVDEVVDAGPDGLAGTSDDVVVREQVELALAPGLIKTSIAPLVVPQARIGSLYGTDLMVRFLPRIDVGDLGSVGFFGLGIRHSISQYVPLLPVNLAGQFSWQTLGISDSGDDVLSASMFAASLIASKSFTVAGVYGGIQFESTDVDVDYTFSADPELADQRVRFSLSGRNRVRALLGTAVTMGPVVLNVDYSVGNMNVVSAGVGLTL